MHDVRLGHNPKWHLGSFLAIHNLIGYARASRPSGDRALTALREGDTLVITTLGRLERSIVNMPGLSEQLRSRGINLRVLNLGGGNVDTGTPMGSMVFSVMAALAHMELDIKRERVTDSVTERRAAGMDLGGRRPAFSDSQITNACWLIDAGQPAIHVARDLGMSRATLYGRIADLDARQWISIQQN